MDTPSRHHFRALALIAAMLCGMFAGVTVSAPTASALQDCESAELVVTPSMNLEPGQPITITGTHFACDAEPALDVAIEWIGGPSVETLAVVDGPDFEVLARVPADAVPGGAVITASETSAVVSVAEPIELPAPEPCPSDPATAHETASLMTLTPVSCYEPCPAPLDDGHETASLGIIFPSCPESNEPPLEPVATVGPDPLYGEVSVAAAAFGANLTTTPSDTALLPCGRCLDIGANAVESFRAAFGPLVQAAGGI